MQKKIEKIIKQVAEETGKPIEVVRAAVESQFLCMKANITTGVSGQPETFKNVRLKHIGLFYARPYKIIELHNKKEANGSANGNS